MEIHYKGERKGKGQKKRKLRDNQSIYAEQYGQMDGTLVEYNLPSVVQ